MEYRIKDYTIKGQQIVLTKKTGIEDVRLIYNETQKVLICSTAKKDNLNKIDSFTHNPFTGEYCINVPTDICVLNATDKLTIKCDYGDNLTSVENKVEEEADSIEAKIDESVNTLSTKIDNIKLPEIDTTELAKESTLNAVSSKLDNLNVEVDLTQVAKQGSNADATNSAILEGINSIFDKFDGHYAVQLKDIIGE